MCSPPPRSEADQEAIWQGLELGDLQVVSSDHAPYAFDATGKLIAGPSPNFKQIANGVPGIEARLPLLFDAMVSKGRLGLAKFVELTATAPARIYNLHPRKGSIAIGADADLVVWDPQRKVTIADGAARPHGLHALRRAHGHGLARDGHPPRRGDHPRRPAQRHAPARGSSCRARAVPRRPRAGRLTRRHGSRPQLRRRAPLKERH